MHFLRVFHVFVADTLGFRFFFVMYYSLYMSFTHVISRRVYQASRGKDFEIPVSSGQVAGKGAIRFTAFEQLGAQLWAFEVPVACVAFCELMILIFSDLVN